jgi:hypothetical protein
VTQSTRVRALQALPIIAIALSLAVGWWFVTAGTGHPGKPYGLWFSEFYDAQGDAFLDGRLDVPCTVIGYEAFSYGGRCYGYFGIWPALIRMPVNALLPQFRGAWTGLSAIAASAVFLLAAYAMLSTLGRCVFQLNRASRSFNGLSAVFLLASGLGSTNVFLLSRPVMYHEALLWGGALTAASLAFSLHHVLTGKRQALFWAALLALLAVHSRTLTGACALAACAVAPIWRGLQSAEPGSTSMHRLRRIPGNRSVQLGVSAALVVLISVSGISYLKFDTLDPFPMHLHASHERRAMPQDVQAYDHNIFPFQNLIWNLRNYWLPHELGLSTNPPFVRVRIPSQEELDAIGLAEFRRRSPDIKIGGVESYLSIPVSMTGLLFLSGIGIVMCGWHARARRWLPGIVACSLISASPIMVFVYASHRYLHEFAPFWVVAGSVGVCGICALPARRRRSLATATALMVAFSVGVHCWFSLRFQSEMTMVGHPIPEARQNVQQIRTWFGQADHPD